MGWPNTFIHKHNSISSSSLDLISSIDLLDNLRNIITNPTSHQQCVLPASRLQLRPSLFWLVLSMHTGVCPVVAHWSPRDSILSFPQESHRAMFTSSLVVMHLRLPWTTPPRKNQPVPHAQLIKISPTIGFPLCITQPKMVASSMCPLLAAEVERFTTSKKIHPHKRLSELTFP